MSYHYIEDKKGELYISPLIKVSDIAGDVYEKGQEKGYSEGYAAGESEGLAAGRDAGYTAGYDAGQAECALKHFAAIVVGDGSETLSFDLPFEPSVVTIQCQDYAKAMEMDLVVLNATFVTDSNAVICGSLQVGSMGTFTVLGVGTENLNKRWSLNEAGEASFGGFAYETESILFGSDVPYAINCIKL